MTPELNVQKALKLYKQRGWQPWAAYTTPRGDEAEAPYRRFLGDAEKAAKTVLAEG